MPVFFRVKSEVRKNAAGLANQAARPTGLEPVTLGLEVPPCGYSIV